MDILKAIEKNSNMVLLTDNEGKIGYVNPVFESATGFDSVDAIGRNLSGFIKEEGGISVGEIYGFVSSGRTWRGRLKNVCKDKSNMWCSIVAMPVKNVNKVEECIWFFEELESSQKDEEDSFDTKDEITDLLNRSGFVSRMEAWLNSANATREQAALILLNIDDFKLLNDAYGIPMGNEFLKRSGGLIESTVAGFDSLTARLGQDEFAIFLKNADPNDCTKAAALLRTGFEGFSPENWGARMTASLGVAFYPDHGMTASELLTHADAAMFRAKELGRNRIQVYKHEDSNIKSKSSRLKSKSSILAALNEDRVILYLQPIVDVNETQASHYEVLARIRDNDGSIITPDFFIHDAERFGLIGMIDRTVLEKVMRVQADCEKKGMDCNFSVNLSGKNLGDEDLLEFINEKLKETGANPERIIFEITETAAVHDMERAIRFITALRAVGFRFSLDDFGVGFTSFVQLKELQVSYIKIDGHFVRRLESDGIDHFFVKAITDVAKGMGIKTIAEYVETEEALGFLKYYGVNYAQGYLLGCPSPIKDVLKF